MKKTGKEENEQGEVSREQRLKNRKVNFTSALSASSSSSSSSSSAGAASGDGASSSENDIDDEMALRESIRLVANKMNLTSQEVIQLLSDERKTRSDPPSPGPSTLSSDALTHAEQAERL